MTFEDQLFPIWRYGYLEKAYFTLCYSPLRDETSAIRGVLVTVFETTARARFGISVEEGIGKGGVACAGEEGAAVPLVH